MPKSVSASSSCISSTARNADFPVVHVFGNSYLTAKPRPETEHAIHISGHVRLRYKQDQSLKARLQNSKDQEQQLETMKVKVKVHYLI